MTSAPLSPLTASIVATLKERIIGWDYPPEHRLTEEALCDEFGVSRSPIREVLRVLVTNGLVKKLANRGYAVKQLDPREVGELYDLRAALELHVVDALAGRSDVKPGLEVLRKIWSSLLSEPGRKGEELAVLDTEFHEALAELAGNRMLLAQLRAINERLLVFRMLDFGRPDRQRSTCRQHMKIVARIGAGDGPGARSAMRRNIDDGRANVDHSIRDALAKAYATRNGPAVRPTTPRPATPRRAAAGAVRRR